MQTKKSFTMVIGILSSLLLVSHLSAQERLKKIRVTYPTESIAVLPLFAAYRWKTFEDNDLQAEIIQARSQVANAMRRWRAARSAISPGSVRLP